MSGILRLAYKLLVNDRGKFAALLVGVAFAAFLMVQMMSLFAGIMAKASSTVTNTGASVWVMDPSVNNIQSSLPLPDYVLDAVRSMDGVRFAVPLYSGAAVVKLRDGAYQPVTVLGLDDASLFGRPMVVDGKIEDIYAENAVLVVADSELPKLGPIHLGSEFEMNDHRAVVAGIAKVPASGLFGVPTLYTTFSRAVQFVPSARFTISFVLVEPKSAAAVPAIRRQVAALGYAAMTEQGFVEHIKRFYKYRTGLGTNILLMTVISFVVGLSISGQTFYTFVLENLERFGALRAIGAKRSELVQMILFQAGFSAVTGYGLGVGLCALLIALAKLRLPSYASLILFRNLGLAFLMVLVIAGLSSYMAVRRVLRIQPFDIFRT